MEQKTPTYDKDEAVTSRGQPSDEQNQKTGEPSHTELLGGQYSLTKNVWPPV